MVEAGGTSRQTNSAAPGRKAGVEHSATEGQSATSRAIGALRDTGKEIAAKAARVNNEPNPAAALFVILLAVIAGVLMG